MIISIVTLLLVFLLTAIRKVGNISFKIWQVMLFGALTVLVTGEISISEGIHSINFDVILFLFSMFVIGESLDESGYLAYLSCKFLKKAKSFDILLLFTIFGAGFASALLMNDTIAVIGTSLVIFFAKKNDLSPKILLLALSFAITIGSVFSPIGNPQNLLIATNSGMEKQFFNFFKILFIPTMVNLFFIYFLIKLFYNGQLKRKLKNNSKEQIKNISLAFLCKISLILLVCLIFLKIIFSFILPSFDFKLTYIAILSSLPIILLSEKRIKILKGVNWNTLIFFIAMFILMGSVWNSGFFQSIIEKLNFNIYSILAIFLVIIILSQFISNVPLVALYIPLLLQAGSSTKEMLALAAGSTIAGNLFILGAASNIIIIQNAEEKYGETLSSLEFARVGVPLTIINFLVYYLFFVLF